MVRFQPEDVNDNTYNYKSENNFEFILKKDDKKHKVRKKKGNWQISSKKRVFWGDWETADDETIASAEAYVGLYGPKGNEGNKRDRTKRRNLATALLSTGTVGAFLLALFGHSLGYDLGFEQGKEEGSDNGPNGPGGPGYNDGFNAKDKEVRENLETMITGNFTEDQVNATEYELFGIDVKDLSEELTYQELVQLQSELFYESGLMEGDVAKAMTDSVLQLINTTHDVPLEDLQAKNLTFMDAVVLHGQLSAMLKGNTYGEGFEAGKEHMKQFIAEWTAQNYTLGEDAGKILGSTELYQQAVEIVSEILDADDIEEANGDIKILLEDYKEAIEDYAYKLTKWDADFTLETASHDLPAAEDALDRFKAMGPEYSVSVTYSNDLNSTEGQKLNAWYTGLSQADADYIQNVTGASVDKWIAKEYNFEFVDVYGDDAVMKVYQDDDVRLYKVSQEFYKSQESWESNYEGE